jgi:hypothetical protein
MIAIECRCGEVVDAPDQCDTELQICPACARIGCFELVEDAEWMCRECKRVGKYWEIPRNSGVDSCPDCKSPITDIEK